MSGRLKLELSPTALVAALVATLVVLAGATWFVLIEPKRSQSNSLVSQIQIANATLNARKHIVAHPGGQKSQSVFIRRALPDTVAMPQVILELSRVAGEEHVTLDSIDPSAPTSYSGFEAVPITIGVTGRFADIQGFLKEIRNQVQTGAVGVRATGRLFDVQSINLAQAPKPPLVAATLTLDVFVYSGVPTLSPQSQTTSGASN